LLKVLSDSAILTSAGSAFHHCGAGTEKREGHVRIATPTPQHAGTNLEKQHKDRDHSSMATMTMT